MTGPYETKCAKCGKRMWYGAIGDKYVFCECVRRSIFGTATRAEAVERISALAGVTPDGGILPPQDKIVIDRTPVTWWKRGF